jgi:DNA polymerase-3 subunit gamma/tau
MHAFADIAAVETVLEHLADKYPPMAAALPRRVLSRAWQMLLKALEEVAQAPNAMMAAEMAIIRLTHVAELPSPGDLVKKLQSTPAPSGGGGGARPMGATPH